MTFPLDELPTEITVCVGRWLDIDLPSYAGGGYSWSVDFPDDRSIAHAVIRQAGDAQPPAPPREPGVTAPPPGPTLVSEQLTVNGLCPGTTRCRLMLRRPFETGPPAAEHVFRTIVLPASPGDH